MSEREPTEDEIDAMVARNLVKKGELLPTTEDEVLAAEEGGAAFEGELPEKLRAYVPREKAAEAGGDRPEASRRVVSITDARARRAGAAWRAPAVTFVLGAAAAAAAIFALRPDPGPRVGGDPAGVPTVMPSASAAPPERIEVPAVRGCTTDGCCAGASCARAEGELRACATGRTCIACAPAAGAVFRPRIGNVLPAPEVTSEVLAGLDVCARVGGSPWSCEAAYADAVTRPRGRSIPILATVEELGRGVELELRARGTTQVFGRWRDAVRVGPNVLCRGVGVRIANEKDAPLGSLSLFFDDAHHVEIARDASTRVLTLRRERITFADVVPSVVETSGVGDARYALTVGPLDAAAAEALRWALVDRGEQARVVLGDDYVGGARELP